jgi:hypothetical protein
VRAKFEICGTWLERELCLSLQGYLRTPNGTVTTFAVPGSSFTNPTAINPARAITGFYFDASGAQHAFLRTPNGTITTCTSPAGINPAGAIVGWYEDAAGNGHGLTSFRLVPRAQGTGPSVPGW